MMPRGLSRAAAATAVMVVPAWLHLVYVTSAAADSAESCKKHYKEEIGQCAEAAISNPARDSSDFSFWPACTDKFKGEYDSCLASASSNRPMVVGDPPLGCAEARPNVDWILRGDAGALQSYRSALAQGSSRLDALIYAQRHNPHAQDVLRKCADWSLVYANSLGAPGAQGAPNAGGPDVADNGEQDDADTRCLAIGPASNNYSEVAARSTPGSVGLWKWTIPVGVTCLKPVRARFCLHEKNDFVQVEDHVFGPGYSTINPVTFNVVSGESPGSGPVWIACKLGQPCDLGC